MHRRRWVRFGRLVAGSRGFQSLLLPLFHELIVFGGAGTGRGVRRHAAEPLGNGIAHAGGEISVDRATACQPARGQRDGKHDGKMAATNGHWQTDTALADENWMAWPVLYRICNVLGRLSRTRIRDNRKHRL